jgi:hypothetical protein
MFAVRVNFGTDKAGLLPAGSVKKGALAPICCLMSRAFVNEDSFIEELPDRPISEHPSLVTERGLELIEAALGTGVTSKMPMSSIWIGDRLRRTPSREVPRLSVTIRDSAATTGSM